MGEHPRRPCRTRHTLAYSSVLCATETLRRSANSQEISNGRGLVRVRLPWVHTAVTSKYLVSSLMGVVESIGLVMSGAEVACVGVGVVSLCALFTDCSRVDRECFHSIYAVTSCGI